MQNIPSMRTGIFDGDEDMSQQKEFMRKVVSLMKIMCEESVNSAERYTKACGRTKITGKDMILALKYESHAFWYKDIDDRFNDYLTEEKEHTYDTEEEDSDEDSEENSTEGSGCDAEHNEEGSSEEEEDGVHSDLDFKQTIEKINDEWEDWNPDDPVKMLLKSSINKTCAKYAQ